MVGSAVLSSEDTSKQAGVQRPGGTRHLGVGGTAVQSSRGRDEWSLGIDGAVLSCPVNEGLTGGPPILSRKGRDKDPVDITATKTGTQ